MLVIRSLGGILLGAIVAIITGAVIDYLRLFPPEQTYRYLYPWLTGLGGIIGSIVTLLLVLPGRSIASGKAGAGTPKRTPTTTTGKTTPSVSAMPSFDFDAARQQSAAERKAAAEKPAREQP